VTKIDIIHTPCKSCVFAIYNGKTQISCELNKIEHYRNMGVEVLEVYDDSQEFFVLNKKRCLSLRNKEWYDKKNLTSINDAKSLVVQENELKYIAVIYFEESTSLDDFNKIIDSLINQKIKPKGIMVIREKYKTYSTSIKDISPILNDLKIPWRLQNFIDEEMTFDHRVRAIIKSAPVDRFYFLIYPSQYKDYNFSEKINSYIQNGHSFGCININDNLFFSYLTLNYVKSLNDSNLLTNKDMHTKYEEIS
jgi:hypothetical protein